MLPQDFVKHAVDFEFLEPEAQLVNRTDAFFVASHSSNERLRRLTGLRDCHDFRRPAQHQPFQVAATLKVYHADLPRALRSGAQDGLDPCRRLCISSFTVSFGRRLLVLFTRTQRADFFRHVQALKRNVAQRAEPRNRVRGVGRVACDSRRLDEKHTPPTAHLSLGKGINVGFSFGVTVGVTLAVTANTPVPKRQARLREPRVPRLDVLVRRVR
mmetsp:Transcript_11749/g.43608  ORF Transcript_11749/g.43608 Transcript_11749/m.43608 type:complete len:214 (-) Transcript_11749:3389-4030(-)